MDGLNFIIIMIEITNVGEEHLHDTISYSIMSSRS